MANSTKNDCVELRVRYEDVHLKLTVLTEIAFALRMRRATPEDTAQILSAALHAVDNWHHTQWNRKSRNVEEWIEVFGSYVLPSEEALASVGSSLDLDGWS